MNTVAVLKYLQNTKKQWGYYFFNFRAGTNQNNAREDCVFSDIQTHIVIIADYVFIFLMTVGSIKFDF